MKIQLNDWIVTGKQAKPILRAILVLNIGFYIFIYNIKRGGSLLIEKIINNNVITTILEEGQEAAFIALHIVNASLGEEMYNTMNITILTKNILKIIKNHFLIEFNEDSLDYIRLVTHLKFFSQRLFKREQVVNEDEDLYEILKDKYPKENECVEKIRKFIEREFNYCIIMQEKIYLIMHIKKVTKKG